jgi:hypothetical protein
VVHQLLAASARIRLELPQAPSVYLQAAISSCNEDIPSCNGDLLGFALEASVPYAQSGLPKAALPVAKGRS